MTTEGKLDQILIATSSIQTELAALNKQIVSLEVIVLHGNGRPGLISRVAVAEEQLADIKWWKRAAIGAVIASLISMAATATVIL